MGNVCFKKRQLSEGRKGAGGQINVRMQEKRANDCFVGNIEVGALSVYKMERYKLLSPYTFKFLVNLKSKLFF